MTNIPTKEEALKRLPDLTEEELENMETGEIIAECKRRGCREYTKFKDYNEAEKQGIKFPDKSNSVKPTLQILQTDEEKRYYMIGHYQYYCSKKCETTAKL